MWTCDTFCPLEVIDARIPDRHQAQIDLLGVIKCLTTLEALCFGLLNIYIDDF